MISPEILSTSAGDPGEAVPTLVTVRSYGDAYIAKCGRCEASATTASEIAAARAAAKHFRVRDDRIRLRRFAEKNNVFYAVPAEAASTAYVTAGELVNQRTRR